jgi:outer membrane lipoprotein carrier protein
MSPFSTLALLARQRFFSTIGFLAIFLMLGGMSISNAWADGIEDLQHFLHEVRSGEASFTQQVISPDGVKQQTSVGVFEFQRPNRFRFAYQKPYEQLIVSNGRQVWLFDPDLNQVTIKAFDEAIGATPAALLSGIDLDKNFSLRSLPNQLGVDWVEALPKNKESSFQYLKIGFRNHELVAIEILDAFGQRSKLDFSKLKLQLQSSLPHNKNDKTESAERFNYVPPAGVDVLQQ